MTETIDLIAIRRRLNLRREDIAHHSRLCYHTICRCEMSNRWPKQFARRLAYQECLRGLLRDAGLTADAIRALGIPDLLTSLSNEIDRIDESSDAMTEKATTP